MNFYQAQEDARRKSWQLGALFTLAVIVLVVVTNLLVSLVYLWTTDVTRAASMSMDENIRRIPLTVWLWVTAGVVGTIAIACLYKYLLVRGGGRAIAESLGGRRVFQNTDDAAEKRLLNVVEEMALASGIAVPPVYVVPEDSINAFAAGFSADDAVIGVNRGTIDHLTRSELQGVIAHEFSHLLNGDTKINLRLIAMLHGILFIGLVGFRILRGFGGSRRSSNDSGGLPFLVLGAGLMVIGYAGTFFANLIKAGVSRQREYLADASAVQYTRDPGGISGALKKIGGLSAGSRMHAARAAEASHMFFGQAVTTFLNSMMATHPPLDERIRAIDPSWDGRFPVLEPGTVTTAPGAASAVTVGLAGSDADALRVDVSVQELPDEVGSLSSESRDVAGVVLADTESTLIAAAHDPFDARALVFAMLMHDDQDKRNAQLDVVLKHSAETAAVVSRLLAHLKDLDALRKLTLLEASMPALKELSNRQYQSFTAATVDLIKGDEAIELFEWVLHRILVKDLKPHFERIERPKVRYRDTDRVAEHCACLLSTIARWGDTDEAARRDAYVRGAQHLGLEEPIDLQDDPNFSKLNNALAHLRMLAPLAKPKLLKACAATALADDIIAVSEGALLQGVSATLDCPLPPSIYGTLHDLGGTHLG